MPGPAAGKGGGRRGGAPLPLGPLRMNPDDKEAPVKLFSTLHPFTERRLSDSEWSQWCLLLDCWTQGFTQWSFERSKPSQPTPQAAWARSQQDKRSNGRQPNSQQARNQTRNRTITRRPTEGLPSKPKTLHGNVAKNSSPGTLHRPHCNSSC